MNGANSHSKGYSKRYSKSYSIGRAAVTPALFIVGLLLAWQGIVVVFDIPEYLLPSPFVIVSTIERSLVTEIAYTAGEAACGFLIASALAFAGAVLFVRFRALERGLFPLAITLKTTPIVAIAPLLVLWLGTGWWSKVAAAVLIAFFPVLVNTVKGLKAPEADFQDLFRTMRADSAQIFRKLRVPYCLPYFFSALKISSSLAIVGAIVGEFVGAEHGLGYLIVISSAHLETPTVFQAIGAAALIGIAMFYALETVEKRVIFWTEIETE
jgi:NitT/TauT family transport system permease protein